MTAAETMLHDPRYPIGRFEPSATVDPGDREEAVRTLAELPERLREAVRHLHDDQLQTPYREGGWTVQQLIHHIADAHMIAFDRTRRALTEDWPEVRGYREAEFARLPDAHSPIEWSLEIIEAVHARWVTVLEAMQEDQWVRGFTHNERGRMRLDQSTMLYAWHSRHHLAHILHLRRDREW